MKKELNGTVDGNLRFFLIGFLIEAAAAALIIFVFAFAMYFSESGYKYAPVFATVAVAVGCLAAAFYTARKIGHRGYFTGIITGGISFAVITLTALIIDSGAVTVNTFFRFIILMLSAVIGGILGVNKAGKKYI